MVPSEAAFHASAVASEWIAASPNLVDVLTWHRGLCSSCSPARYCGEYSEIIAEYGAGTFGASVFYPDGERM